MTQETKHEKYTRLTALIKSTYDDHDLTSDEKREIGDILADNMTPHEYNCDVQEIGDIWYQISEDYASLTDLDVALEYAMTDDCEDMDEWIRENGLPLPGRDEMIEHIVNNIDEEEYINEYYEDILDMLPEQCEFNLSDDEIVGLFEVYVVEPVENDESDVKVNVFDPKLYMLVRINYIIGNGGM